ncbi:MAG: DUF2079 domain-containing protein [Propionibacteriaceae bacterium]|nr:DUF2079 domain-containing protein [Propionibacteriaceae bacterium]
MAKVDEKARRLTRARRPAWLWQPAWAITGGGLVLYVTFTLQRWHRLASASWDLAIFEQAVKGYAHLGAPIVDIKGPGFNQLGDHFSPLLAVLAPFYRLWPTPVTLLLAQCFLLALSILPVTLAAKRFLGPAPALLLGAAYALAWGFQSGLSVEFHEYCLAVPLLAFALTSLLASRWTATATFALLLLGVKEDLGLTTAAIGLLMFAQGRRRQRQPAGQPAILGEGDTVIRAAKPAPPADPGQLADAKREARLGAVVAAVGIAAMAVILVVVIPAFNPAGQWDYWGRLENSDGQATGGNAVAAVLQRLPDLVFSFFTNQTKVTTSVLLAGLVVGACVVSRYALLALPTLLWRFSSPVEGLWGTGWHNSLVLMPIIFAAGIDGLRRLRRSPSPAVRRYSRLAPALSLVFALLLTSQFPFHELADPKSWAKSDRDRQAHAVLALIADGSTIATDAGLIIRLPARTTTYWISSLPDQPVDYLLLDTIGGGWNVDPGDPSDWAENHYPGTDYQTIYGGPGDTDNGGYRLAKLVD